VTVGDDAGDASIGDGVCRSTLASGACTLRAAIQESNARSGANTIALGPRVHRLTLPEELIVTDHVRLQGAGSTQTVIDGMRRDPGVFNVQGAEAWLTDLSVTGGGPNVSSGGALFIDEGAFVSLGRVEIRGNEAFSSGGGIHLENGTLILQDVSVTDNTATGAFAGGIYIDSAGVANIDRSAFVANRSNRSGAISNFGRLTITNSTFSGNSAISTGRGTGAIINARMASLNNVTIYQNTSSAFDDPGSSAGGLNSTGRATTAMSNTIIAGNTRGSRPSDCSGTIGSSGYNLIQTTDDCTLTGTLSGNITGRDPDLLPLGTYHGARTRSHAPRPTSPAVNAGHPQVGAGVSPVGRCEPRDQAARIRLLTGTGRRCDIGSIEQR
jgi:hypothetical protein